MTTEAQAAYNNTSDELTAAHAEVRALTANKAKTVEMVKTAYDHLDAARANFNTAKGALDAAERA